MGQPAGTMPTWATDTNFASGTESGLTTKEEPSAGQIAQGDVAGLAAPAVWSNWWKNKVGLWIAYLKNLHNDSDFLGFAYDWIGAHSFASTIVADGGVNITGGNNLVIESTGEVNYDAPRQFFLRRQFKGSGQSGPNHFWGASSIRGTVQMEVTSGGSDLRWIEPVEVPTGAEITAWRALVTNDANSVTGITMSVRLWKQANDFSGPSVGAGTAIGAADTATGTNSLQTLEITGLSEVVDNAANHYFLEIGVSITPASTVQQLLHNYEIAFEMPGLRNPL